MTHDDQADQAPPASPDQPKVETPENPPPAARRPVPALITGAVGGLAVVIIAGAGGVVAWPFLQPLLLGDQTQRLSAVERTLGEVNARLAAVERETARGSGQDVAGLGQRVAALEAQAHNPATDPRVNALADQADHLTADVTRLQGDIDALRRAMPSEGSILRLAERVESAEKEARQIASQHASAQALLLVVGQLREAVDRGEPYQAELRAARRVAGSDDAPSLDALAADAATGIPTRQALIAAFPGLANDVVRADYSPSGGAWWQRALNKLTSLVTVRRTDGQGDDTASIAARAEALAKQGDLLKAASALADLKGQPAQVATSWIREANARSAADRALSDLAASAAAQTAKNGE
jgi:hypothetical protein